jgi:hypothetical protein
MSWLVRLKSAPEATQSIMGQLRIEHGALIFYDRLGRISISFAPGTWLSVEAD